MNNDQLSFPFILDNSFTVSNSIDTIDILSPDYSYNSSYDSMASTICIDSLSPLNSYHSFTSNIDEMIDLSNSSMSISANKASAVVITTSKNTIDMDKLYETVNTLAERLAVISADEDLLAKYPTLRDAYDSYRLIESLVKNDKDKE